MGAKCIYDVAIENTTPAMAQSEIVRRVEAHTGRKVGIWEVTSSTYTTPDKKRAPIQVISFSDLPTRLFVLANTLVTETDSAFPELIRKISLYQSRLSRTIRGSEYDFADFCLRVGLSFDRHNAATGVVVEIEYRPCPVTKDCARLIAELMERIAAPLVPPPQASQDPAASEAATTPYNFHRVEVEVKVAAKDMSPFTHRSAALLYAKLLR